MDKITSIKGKRILFFAPSFFGYEMKIKEKMEQMGAVVDFYDERSVTKSLDRALLKIIPMVFNRRTKKYFNDILQKSRDNEYDFVFIIKCEMITREVLIKMHNMFPDAKFCLYLYDSVRNIGGIVPKFQYFDRVLSFDKDDTLRYPDIKFRPLFYNDDFQRTVKPDMGYKYDISFCGTIHSDRFAIIQKVQDICNNQKLNFYKFCYLQSNFIYYFYKVMKREFRFAKKKEFSFVKTSSREISNIVDESRVILDIQHPKQTGLTMRTIEMVGMNKKLVTTNPAIKKYDFYNPNNILVVDRKDIGIPEGFLASQYIPLHLEIYQKYSLLSWVNDILF